MPRKPLPVKIEPVNPPEKAVRLIFYSEEMLSGKMAMGLSQKLRKLYAKYLDLRKFGEMENAILTYDAARSLALVSKKIVGAISFHQDPLSAIIFIDHVGTLLAPKGTGAELVRLVVDIAYKGRWGMALESTYDAMQFWVRLGFKKNKTAPYVFEADSKRVGDIRTALGSIGRIKNEN